MPPKLKR